MSLGCAGCGDCCDPVHLDAPNRDKVDKWRGYVGGTEVGYDVDFILQHWTEVGRYEGGATYECDRFDPATRRCTAHDERPLVCSAFPWYGETPSRVVAGETSLRCSYLLDVRPADRPVGARPLIPIRPT